MLEIMVVLAVLALSIGVLSSGASGPSDSVKAQGRVAVLSRDIANTHNNAARLGQTQRLYLLDDTCIADGYELVFFSDGTAEPVRFCILVSAQERWFEIDPLTATLIHATAP